VLGAAWRACGVPADGGHMHTRIAGGCTCR
jgi:hypothetical protein